MTCVTSQDVAYYEARCVMQTKISNINDALSAS